MSKANVIFTLDGVNLTIQCTTEDKMKDICKSYSTKINKNINSLLFLYEGNQVNFELIFKEQANDIDKINNQMAILVSECDAKNNSNPEKPDETIFSNKKIGDSTANTKPQKDNTTKTSSNNSLNNQLKNINNEDIKDNNEKIKNLYSDCVNNNNKRSILNGNLLGNIKSIYFSRILFSHLDEKIKLKVIKYNKKLQNDIDIKLINYKFYSRKYIIYETKFKGKEYELCFNNNFNLVFEGEYLNCERNGKGKEYDSFNSNLIFEGEYLNGKRNGKGKEYDEFDGKLIFEGEYLNDKRNGNGKEY